MPRQVFLSYAREDFASARLLAEKLHAAGNSVWIDVQNIAFGDDFVLAIEKAISSCDAVLLLLSENYFTSEWPQYEWATAVRASRVSHLPVIPVLLDHKAGNLMPGLLRSLVYVDASAGIEDAIPVIQQRLSAA